MITIETNRLLLRNYKVTDFEDILKYFSDEEVSKFEDFYHVRKTGKKHDWLSGKDWIIVFY